MSWMRLLYTSWSIQISRGFFTVCLLKSTLLCSQVSANFWIFVTSSNQIKFPIKTISFMIMVNLKFYLQFAMEGGSKVFCRCDPLMEPSSVSVVIILLKSSEMLLELIPILRYVPDLVDKKDERDLKRLLYYASQKQLSSLLMWKTHVLFQVLYQKWQCRMWYSIFRCHCYEFSLEA